MGSQYQVTQAMYQQAEANGLPWEYLINAGAVPGAGSHFLHPIDCFNGGTGVNALISRHTGNIVIGQHPFLITPTTIEFISDNVVDDSAGTGAQTLDAIFGDITSDGKTWTWVYQSVPTVGNGTATSSASHSTCVFARVGNIGTTTSNANEGIFDIQPTGVGPDANKMGRMQSFHAITSTPLIFVPTGWEARLGSALLIPGTALTNFFLLQWTNIGGANPWRVRTAESGQIPLAATAAFKSHYFPENSFSFFYSVNGAGAHSAGASLPIIYTKL